MNWKDYLKPVERQQLLIFDIAVERAKEANVFRRQIYERCRSRMRRKENSSVHITD